MADGSDVAVVVAEVVDKRGTVKRLNNSIIRFQIEGEGRLLGDASVGVNPMPVNWGSAPALVQATNRAGKINITASLLVPGQARPLEGTLEIESVPDKQRQIFSANELEQIGRNRQEAQESPSDLKELMRENAILKKELNQLKVKEVEQQQTQFGKGIND